MDRTYPITPDPLRRDRETSREYTLAAEGAFTFLSDADVTPGAMANDTEVQLDGLTRRKLP